MEALAYLYKEAKGLSGQAHPPPAQPAPPAPETPKPTPPIGFDATETVILSTPGLRPFIVRDRQVLESVPRWIEDSVYKNSLFLYGFPEYVYNLIDKPQGDEPTYADVLSYLGDRYFVVPKTYLEIGVSVGKTIYQMVNAYTDSHFFAYELESINPTLENFFSEKQIQEKWTTMPGSARKDQSSLTTYTYPKNHNKFTYLTADVFDKNSWQRFKGNKFNIIFSDGLHSPDAVNHELDMLLSLDLIPSDKFLIWYDDLESMRDSFFRTFTKLKEEKFPWLSKDNIALVKVRGAFGVNEYQHLNGVITNLNITKIIHEELSRL